jgi:hypothetical protein
VVVALQIRVAPAQLVQMALALAELQLIVMFLQILYTFLLVEQDGQMEMEHRL